MSGANPSILYFFGVLEAGGAGHFLHSKDGRKVWSHHANGSFPFKWDILDGGLLHAPEVQGRLHLAVINGWTVLGMWDRTGDSRGGCNSSFIAEGVFDLQQMKEMAARDFPVVWQRIQSAKKEEAL